MHYVSSLEEIPSEFLLEVEKTAREALRNGMVMAIKVLPVFWELEHSVIYVALVRNKAVQSIICSDGQRSPYVDPACFITLENCHRAGG